MGVGAWEPTTGRLLGSQAWFLTRNPGQRMVSMLLSLAYPGLQIKHLKTVYILT